MGAWSHRAAAAALGMLILGAGTAGALTKALPPAPTTGTPVLLTVDAKANIFGAGHAVPPGPSSFNPAGAGILPPGVQFVAATDNVFAVTAASGSVSCCGAASPDRFNGADGHLAGANFPCGDRAILGYGGISGITDRERYMFLIGAFLDDSEPADPQPPALDVTGKHDLADLFPALRQLFFVGDGKTASGQVQTFHAPKGATRLFLGFADAVCFQGLPGGYADNVGSLSVTLAEVPAVTVASAAFVATWRASELRGELVLSGSFKGTNATLVLRVTPPAGEGLTFRIPVGAGAFSKRVKLPATLLPGRYLLEVSGTSGGFSLAVPPLRLQLAAPPEGVVDKAYISGQPNGPPAVRLPGKRSQMSAHFHFAALPRGAGRLTATWFAPGGKSVGTVDKPRTANVVSTLKSGAPLTKGTWRCVLSFHNVTVKQLSIRLG
jgi:hypothetical protein